MLLKQRTRPALGLTSCLLGLALGLAGCAPFQVLRDDYMGKDVLQPEKVDKGVRRDEMGNAIPEEE